jgi:hypothetical protein
LLQRTTDRRAEQIFALAPGSKTSGNGAELANHFVFDEPIAITAHAELL